MLRSRWTAHAMTERHRYALLVWGGLASAAAALSVWHMWAAWSGTGAGVPIGEDIRRTIVLNSILPRAAAALLAGATLAVSGLVLQRVLRNPLAEPQTLGIFSGANLAMALATLYAPWLLATGGREAVAFAGGIGSMLLILGLTWRRGMEPVSLILAGMMVSLTSSSLSAALVLANGEYLYTLFIWGGGSLVQTGWAPSCYLLLMLVTSGGLLALSSRALAVLGLDDRGARSLGVAPAVWRLSAIALSVALATTVAAEIGVIGFVGLAAPALAEFSGARRFSNKLIAAPLIGAILLWLTDGLVQLTATSSGEWIPTGAATAFLGGPLLLWMLLRLRLYEWHALAAGNIASKRIGRPLVRLSLLAGAVVLAALLTLVVGRGPGGLHLASGELLADLVDLRLPRIAIAASTGAMLGAAGMILQRITGNPLASPEILGLSSAAGVGLTAVLTLSPLAGVGAQFVGLVCGAMAAIAMLVKIADTKLVGPERLLLAGVAIGAMGNAVVAAVVAAGDQRAFSLMRWLSGSTHDAHPNDGWLALAGALALIAPILFAVRWLTVLPLGSTVSKNAGIDVERARLLLVLLAGLLSAAAALFIGPLSLVGLAAPHISRAIGFASAASHFAGSVLLGSGLLVVADWLSRTVTFPYELPLSLVASLIAGPYLVYLLSRGISPKP
jgi:ABC-type Fe3+-siderophore transport system permease subunit